MRQLYFQQLLYFTPFYELKIHSFNLYLLFSLYALPHTHTQTFYYISIMIDCILEFSSIDVVNSSTISSSNFWPVISAAILLCRPLICGYYFRSISTYYFNNELWLIRLYFLPTHRKKKYILKSTRIFLLLNLKKYM